MAIHCKRCWKIFRNQEQLDEHIRATEICELQAGQPPEGLTVEAERKIRIRKKLHPGQTEEDRWREIYKLLFPTEEIPSPCKSIPIFKPGTGDNIVDFEPVQEDVSNSSDSRELENYERYIRRELPGLVREHIEALFRQETRPIETSLIGNLVNTMRESQERLFETYRARMSDDLEAQMLSPAPMNSFPDLECQGSRGGKRVLDEGITVTNQQEPRPDEFLNAGSQQQSLIQTMNYEKDPSNSNTSSIPVSPQDELSSDSGYGTEQVCYCPDLCILHSMDFSQDKRPCSPTSSTEQDSLGGYFAEHEWNPDEYFNGEAF